MLLRIRVPVESVRHMSGLREPPKQTEVEPLMTHTETLTPLVSPESMSAINWAGVDSPVYHLRIKRETCRKVPRHALRASTRSWAGSKRLHTRWRRVVSS